MNITNLDEQFFINQVYVWTVSRRRVIHGSLGDLNSYNRCYRPNFIDMHDVINITSYY